MKRCTKCQEWKPLDQFHHHLQYGKRRAQPMCKPCKREYERAQYHNDPRRQEKLKAQTIAFNKRNRERMAIDPAYQDFMRMRYIAWNLKVPLADVRKVWGSKSCEICDITPKRLMTDHNHATGKVRGRLCNHCNWMLGHAKDDSSILRKGADYLEKN